MRLRYLIITLLLAIFSLQILVFRSNGESLTILMRSDWVTFVPSFGKCRIFAFHVRKSFLEKGLDPHYRNFAHDFERVL